MNVFDLLFIACVLGTLGYGIGILVLLGRQRWSSAGRHAIRLAVALGVYLGIVIVVGIASERRVLPATGILRYDDWCLAVEKARFADTIGAETAPTGQRFLVVTLNVISKARRVRQAAPAGALVYVVDGAGTRYDVSSPGQAAYERQNGVQPELTTKLDPNSSFQTTRVFVVPRQATTLFLGHQHGTGALFPGVFIIREGFRKPPVIRLGP